MDLDSPEGILARLPEQGGQGMYGKLARERQGVESGRTRNWDAFECSPGSGGLRWRMDSLEGSTDMAGSTERHNRV